MRIKAVSATRITCRWQRSLALAVARLVRLEMLARKGFVAAAVAVAVLVEQQLIRLEALAAHRNRTHQSQAAWDNEPMALYLVAVVLLLYQNQHHHCQHFLFLLKQQHQDLNCQRANVLHQHHHHHHQYLRFRHYH